MLRNLLSGYKKRTRAQKEERYSGDLLSKKGFIVALFAFSLLLFVWLFFIFIKPFVTAALLTLATSSFSDKISARLERSRYALISANRELISASALTFAFAIFVFAPIAYAIVFMVSEASSFSHESLPILRDKVVAFAYESEFLGEEAKAKLLELLTPLLNENFWLKEAKTILGSVGGFFGEIASSLAELALVAVFFFLLHWFKSDVAVFIKSLIPLEKEQKEMMTSEITGAITVVFFTFLGVMAAQGAAFFALMLFFDYNAPILGFFTALSSVVPIFGTGLVWIPVALLEFFRGNVLNAVLISLYSWIVMAVLIDNFLRLYFLNAATKSVSSAYKINEFLMFFSIAAGIAAFGFWGVIIGPSITALFLSSARIIRR